MSFSSAEKALCLSGSTYRIAKRFMILGMVPEAHRLLAIASVQLSVAEQLISRLPEPSLMEGDSDVRSAK